VRKYNNSVEIPNFSDEIRGHEKPKRNLILGTLALVVVGACVYGAVKYHNKIKNILIVDEEEARDIFFMKQADIMMKQAFKGVCK